MRVETIETEVYTYPELSEQAKEVVRQWFIDGKIEDTDIFTENCEESLKSLFPKSKLNVQYSLNNCQGDGFNIYGTLDIEDVLKQLDFKKEDIEKVENLLQDDCIELKENRRYCYSLKNQENINDIVSEMEDIVTEDKHTFLISVFKKIFDYMGKLDSEYEKDGYDFFYEISEEEIAEMCECNEYEFTKDGKIY